MFCNLPASLLRHVIHFSLSKELFWLSRKSCRKHLQWHPCNIPKSQRKWEHCFVLLIEISWGWFFLEIHNFFSIERFLDIFPFLQFFLHLEREFVSLIIASHVWCLKALRTLFKKITSAYLIDFLNKRKEFLSLSLSLALSSHIHCACLIFFSVSLEKTKKKKVVFSALNMKSIPVEFTNCQLSDLYKKGSSSSYLSVWPQCNLCFVCSF